MQGVAPAAIVSDAHPGYLSRRWAAEEAEMTSEEIREMDKADIQARIGELKEELFRLKFRSATMALENPRLIPNIKKDIARLNTILRERELAAQKS